MKSIGSHSQKSGSVRDALLYVRDSMRRARPPATTVGARFRRLLQTGVGGRGTQPNGRNGANTTPPRNTRPPEGDNPADGVAILPDIFPSSLFIRSYGMILVVLYLLTTFLLDPSWSTTIAHVIHCLASFAYFHWQLGNMGDTQDDVGNMTLWEQLERTGNETKIVRTVLTVVPFFLCLIGCYTSDWDISMVELNVALLVIEGRWKLGNSPSHHTPGYDQDD